MFLRSVGWSSVFAVLLAGCMQVTDEKAAPTPEGPSSEVSGSEVTADEATPRKTIGETTQVVLDLQQAVADGGVAAATSVTSGNPLLQQAEAYRTSVAKIGGIAVQQAIAVRNAQSIQDPKPLTHQQFLDEIIKPERPDGIRLPMLPYYQEYAWDEAGQKLVVVDFPARKEARRDAR